MFSFINICSDAAYSVENNILNEMCIKIIPSHLGLMLCHSFCNGFIPTIYSQRDGQMATLPKTIF